MIVWIPMELPSASNLREHHMVRHARVKAQREAVGWKMLAALREEPQPLPVTVTLTRVGVRRLDDDNLRGACKAPRDAIAKALGVDDADERVTWEYAQETHREARGLKIKIERRTT